MNYLMFKDVQLILDDLGFRLAWQDSYQLNDKRYGCESIYGHRQYGLIAHLVGKILVGGSRSYFFLYGSIHGEGMRLWSDLPEPLNKHITVLNKDGLEEHFSIRIPSMEDFAFKECMNNIIHLYRLRSKWTRFPNNLDLMSEKEVQYDYPDSYLASLAEYKLAMCPKWIKRIVHMT